MFCSIVKKPLCEEQLQLYLNSIKKELSDKIIQEEDEKAESLNPEPSRSELKDQVQELKISELANETRNLVISINAKKNGRFKSRKSFSPMKNPLKFNLG